MKFSKAQNIINFQKFNQKMLWQESFQIICVAKEESPKCPSISKYHYFIEKISNIHFEIIVYLKLNFSSPKTQKKFR